MELFFNVLLFQTSDIFLTKSHASKILSMQKIKKKKTPIFPLFAVLIFFSPPFLFFFFFNIVAHLYASLLYEIRIYYISFSILLNQKRLFMFHSCRYKNLIHIISFLLSYPTLSLSFYHAIWEETRGSLTPLNG